MINVSDMRDQYSKLQYALSCLHSDRNAGVVDQLDFDVRYFGYCFHMAKIKRDIAAVDKCAAFSLDS